MPMSEWNKKRRVMRHYDQSANVYDAQYCEEQGAKIRTALENLTLNQESIVLDAGCGTGLLFARSAEKAKFVVGIDISKSILKEAMKKVKQYKNVALIQSDIDNLPLSDRAFNVVFAVTLLQNVPNPMATLNEIKRVSEPNATIVVTGLRKAFTKEGFAKLLRQANLRVAVVKTDERMKEYVGVCTKMRR